METSTTCKIPPAPLNPADEEAASVNDRRVSYHRYCGKREAHHLRISSLSGLASPCGDLARCLHQHVKRLVGRVPHHVVSAGHGMHGPGGIGAQSLVLRGERRRAPSGGIDEAASQPGRDGAGELQALQKAAQRMRTAAWIGPLSRQYGEAIMAGQRERKSTEDDARENPPGLAVVRREGIE